METQYVYIGLILIGGFILIRFLYIRNEKDKKNLEDKLNNDFKKIQETEINDNDLIN